LTQKFLLLETHGEERKDVEGKNEEGKTRREENTKKGTVEHEGKIPTHKTNVYHSTPIHPSAVLISSESLHNFTSL